MGPFDPKATLEDAVAATGGLFRDANADLVVAVDPATAPLKADRDRMMQVYINLLSNAAKFCDLDHGRVEVAGRPAEGGYLVEVSDNGEGVSEQDRQIIFEKFAKARHRNTGRPSGSGLGLTISRHIVEHHGGRIWVKPEARRGATFCVFLPATTPPADAAPTVPELAGAK